MVDFAVVVESLLCRKERWSVRLGLAYGNTSAKVERLAAALEALDACTGVLPTASSAPMSREWLDSESTCTSRRLGSLDLLQEAGGAWRHADAAA